MKRLKRHPDSRSFTWKISISLLVFAVLAIALFLVLVFLTDFFTVKEIVVSGVSRLDENYVKRISGVRRKQSIFTVNVRRIESNLKLDPWIERAEISRSLPDSLRIRVFERSVCAVMDFEGVRYAVDRKGYIIGREKLKEYKVFPVLKGIALKIPTVGTTISDGKARKCLEIIGSLPREISQLIREVYFSSDRGVCFKGDLGWGSFELIYGNKEETSLKNEVLAAVINDIKINSRKIKYIDIRVPDAPVIRE